MVARRDWIDKSDTNPETQVHKNDIWYENGGFGMCSGIEAYAQTIEAVIKTVYGEIQVDREYGIPYFSTVWTNARLVDQWAKSVRAAVDELPFVDKITSFTYEIDSKTHELNYKLNVTTKSGTDVVVEN